MNYDEIYRRKDGGAYRHIKTTMKTTITTAISKAGSQYAYQLRAYAIVNAKKVYTPLVTLSLPMV